MLQLVSDKKVVNFQNPGLIPVTAITTMGVNAKENENPIGYFGTGLKYAIAITLRLGGKFTIWRGKEKYEFAIRHETIRGKDFDIVTMNGQDLGFTTELGKNWEAWQAFRELYCNALDEDGSVVNKHRKQQESVTTIEVEGVDAIYRSYDERDRIVLPKKTPLVFSEGIEIHPPISNHLYYRGIRVHTFNKAPLYTYNITSIGFQLSEDRTLLDYSQMRACIARTITKSENEEIIRRAITAEEEWESTLDYSFLSKPGPTFIKVVEELFKDRKIVNDTALKLCRNHSDLSNIKPPKAELTEVQKERLEYAKEALKSVGINIVYEIYPVDTMDHNVHGLADRISNTIFIAKKALDRPPQYVAAVLFEEYIHLHTGYGDSSMGFQSEVVDRFGELTTRYYELKKNNQD